MALNLKLETLNKVIHQFGSDIVADLITEIKQKDKIASGKLLASLTYDLQDNLPLIHLYVFGEEHYRWVEDGRKSGRMPPLNRIKQWCAYRNIPLKYAYPIAKKIGAAGIKPTPLLTEVLKKRALEFERKVSDAWRLDVQAQLDEIVKQI